MMLMFRRIWGDCQHRSGSRGVPAPGLPGRTQTHRRAGIAVDILQFKCQQFRKLKFYSIWSKLNDARSMSVGHQSLIARNNIQRSYTRTSSQFNDHGWGWNKCEGDAPHVVGVGRRGVEEVQWLFSILVKHRYNTSVAEHDRITLSCSPVPPTPGLLLCEKENIDKSELMAAPDTTAESPAYYWTTIWMQLGRKHPDLAWFLSSFDAENFLINWSKRKTYILPQSPSTFEAIWIIIKELAASIFSLMDLKILFLHLFNSHGIIHVLKLQVRLQFHEFIRHSRANCSRLQVHILF